MPFKNSHAVTLNVGSSGWIITALTALALLLIFLVPSPLVGADHYITVIDLSGSMNAKEKSRDGKESSRLEFVRTAVESNIRTLPNEATLYLVAFNKGVVSQASSLSMASEQDRKIALSWIEQRRAPDGAKTFLWTTTDYALRIARDIQTKDPSATIFVRILTDGEDTEGVTTFSKVIDKYPEVDGQSLHVNFLTLGIELSIPPKQGVTVTPVNDWEDIFPPVVHHFPEMPKVGNEIALFYKSQSKYDRVEWWVDERNLGGESKLTLTAPAGENISIVLKAFRGEDVRVAKERIPISPPDLNANFTVAPEKGLVGSDFNMVSRSKGSVAKTTYRVVDENDELAYSSDGPDAVFSTENPGTYRIIQTVIDQSGKYTDEAEKTLVVALPKLEANLMVIPATVDSGGMVRVVDRSVGTITKRAVNFGNNSKPRTETPFFHTYEIEGEEPKKFTVELSVEDKYGQTASATKEITVIPQAPPTLTAAFSVIPGTGEVGDKFHLVSRNTAEVGSSSFTVFNEANEVVLSSDLAEAVIAPDKPGIFRVLHKVEDTTGKYRDESETSITVLPPEISAGLVVVPEIVQSGDEVRVVDQSSGDIVSRSLDFGNEAGIQTDPPFSHVYRINGETPVKFPVSLTVTDKFGNTSTATQEVTVTPPILPDVRFSIDTGEEDRVEGAPIRFLNESDNIAEWRWFVSGEKVEATERNPAITFPRAGRYLVALEASGKGGKNPVRFEREIVVLNRYEEPVIKEILVSNSTGRIPFENTISSDIAGDYETLTWTLPGGKTVSDTEEVTIFVDQPGVHSIALEVVGKGSSPEKSTSSIEIVAKNPLSKWVTLGIPSTVGVVIFTLIALTLIRRIGDRKLSGSIIVSQENGSDVKQSLKGKEFSLEPFGAPDHAIRYAHNANPELFRKGRKIKTLSPNKMTTAGRIQFRYLRS